MLTCRIYTETTLWGLVATIQTAIEIIWPVACFFVLASTTVQCLSALAISTGNSDYSRQKDERVPMLGSERGPLDRVCYEDRDNEFDISSSEDSDMG